MGKLPERLCQNRVRDSERAAPVLLPTPPFFFLVSIAVLSLLLDRLTVVERPGGPVPLRSAGRARPASLQLDLRAALSAQSPLPFSAACS